ncbi:hypothetical protein [Pendulispora albinea]|uniref:Uncharacterized protein n=1 Tax=Pendulispora albinea TaxID=2741071 RepID=A0ABZ2M6X0_9BACT
MPRILQNTRIHVGAPPRSPHPGAPFAVRPGWLSPSDPLDAAHRELPRLLEHGDIVLGHVVLANEALFRGAASAAAGCVVHPRDPAVRCEVDELQRATRAILELRGATPADPDQAELARILDAETERCFSMPVPPVLTRGKPLFFSTVIFYAPHFPEHRLVTNFLPMLVCADVPQVAQLPAFYWAQDFLDAWCDIGAV